MNLDPRVPLNVCDETKGTNTMLEIINMEKQLWSLIYSKGLLHKEARDLYMYICSEYENLILVDNEDANFQEIEYSLWKLHYKHIHEFRLRIRQSSSRKSHVEQYKSFLKEATKFYQNLISRMRNFYGVGEAPLSDRKGDPLKLNKCRYSCHRFLVCIGDLARYRELCEDIDARKRDWSVAAKYYFKAAATWPDSGNPQNQLAVLAKYIGDDFLALYHCIRSLAVKEPFPDARNNLILLLEENRSSHLESLSRETHFKFLNPSGRSSPPKVQANDHISSTKSAFWPLFVRMISLFFIESSSEEFAYTFASTMRELELLFESNDAKLSTFLESYQYMDSARTGPYRSLQLISILIFVVDSLTTSFDHKNSKEITKLNQPNLVKSALSATFIILGRLIERSLKGNLVKSNPLLPSVLVFVEWFVGMLEIIQKYIFHEEVSVSVSYFLETFVEFLNKFETRDNLEHQKDIAIWEDHELRGFAPLASLHKTLNFRTCEESMGEYSCGNVRVCRIFNAAMKIIVKNPNCLKKWIFYDTESEKFFTAELQKTVSEPIIDKEKKNSKLLVIEEEEEIIFKPLTRYNSSPIDSPNEKSTVENWKDEAVPPDDSPRRATSYPASPPSLNAWVLDKENKKAEKEKAESDFFKLRLTPIEETGSFSLIDTPPYSDPIPSAPLLPENALVLCDKSDISSFDGPLNFTPMNSSQWLHQFRNQNQNLNLNCGNYLVQPGQFYTPGNLYGHDLLRWEFSSSNPNQIVYPAIPMIYNYQRLGAYGCGGGGDVAEMRVEQPPLLRYLQEKEWQLQNQGQVRGPSYMGN